MAEQNFARTAPESPYLLKHLDYIQATIVRMAANSFLVKGWAVTFVAGILAFTGKDANRWGALVALLPAVLFWRLDGYFLVQERLYRRLYDEVRQKAWEPDPVIDFSLDTTSYATEGGWWTRLRAKDSVAAAMLSKTIWGFYTTLVLVVLVVAFAVPRLSEK